MSPSPKVPTVQHSTRSQGQSLPSECELGREFNGIRYRRVFETAKDGIIVMDGETAEILDVNERICEMFGYAQDKLLGKKIWDAPPFRAHDVGRRIFLELKRQEVVRLEAELNSGEGSVLPVEFLANVYDEDGRRVIQCNARDITERKQTETALQDSEERFRLLVQGVKDYAIFLMDARGVIMSWNIGAERVLGYRESEILGKHFSIIFIPEDQRNAIPEREMGTAAKMGHSPDERWHVRKDGSQFFASGELSALPGEDGELRGFAKLMRDVTERRKTEEALRETHKMESIGVLAGGVAHDFNNLLTGILGNASLALENLTPMNPTRAMIEDVVTYSKKAADLTKQLLAYAGKGRFHIQRVDLSDLVFEMVKLVRPSVPKKVRLLIDLASDPAFIEADAVQIQQIVMNLVINAGEAIGEKEGTIRVSTGAQHIAGPQADSVLGLNSGRGEYFYLEVSDSGSGMDDEIKARIFDPFFTTKFTGRGLGLAAVSGIARAHKAMMTIRTKAGEGTTFRVFFPAVKAQPPAAVGVSRAHDLRGSGTILVVDDDEVVSRTAKSALEHYGYNVLLAENGRQALDIFRDRSGDIALVLLDLAMPVMSGEEAYEHFGAINPRIPIVITSGHSELASHPFQPATAAGFLQKPYTVVQLAQKIKSIVKKQVQ